MIDFDRAVEIIFELEGYDETVVDTGGLTKWGISQRAYPHLDILSLTKDDAKNIYRKDYWNASSAGKLAWPLNLYLFDSAVNQGVNPAIKMLQKAAGGLSIDGIMGKKTLARINGSDRDDLCARFMAQRAIRYQGTRGFDRYGYGWFSRLFRLTQRS